ncbi:MAG: 1,4-dihydroxy-2-naphthoate polyprenyltransferase [Candidatus Zixiibacteriota bacterium]|mgnify:CR=1 FL=1
MAASLGTWIMAARPRTLPAAASPVIMGAALAYDDGGFHLFSALAALIGALLIQIGTNFANDYFDHIKGVDTEHRTGPTRATQAGLVSPRQMIVAASIVFGLAIVVGTYLVMRGGWPIVVIGLAGIACGYLYTGGPAPIGYIGLGDLFVLVFFGPVAVGGTYYVQTNVVTKEALIVGIAAGLMSTAILTVNNLRDADTDSAVGKKTLAVRFGKRFARWEYLICVVVAGLIPSAMTLNNSDHRLVLLTLAVFPFLLKPTRKVFAQKSSELNTTLADTGKALFLFSLLFALGWIL